MIGEVEHIGWDGVEDDWLLVLLFYSTMIESARLNLISLFTNHVDHFVNIFLADIVVRCLYHDTNNRLRARFADKDTSCIT